jgi:hypothetical protein
VRFALILFLWLLPLGASASRRSPYKESEDTIAFINGASRAFEEHEVSRNLRLAFLANAWHESGMAVEAESASHLPDSKSGGSFTAYQILYPNLVKSLQPLGYTLSDVIPVLPMSPEAREEYAYRQTRVALQFYRDFKYSWDPKNEDYSALNLFSKWAAWSWGWNRVIKTPEVAAILGRGPMSEDIQDLREKSAELYTAGLPISGSAVLKFATYKSFQSIM